MSIKNFGKGLGRWAAVCGLVFGVLCLAGCRSQPHGQQLAETPGGGAATSAGAAVTNSSALEPEVLRIGDSLTVSFIDTPNPIPAFQERSEEHTSELQSLRHLVCRLLLEKKK